MEDRKWTGKRKREEKKRNGKGNKIFCVVKENIKRKDNKLKKLRKKNFVPNSFHLPTMIPCGSNIR